VHAKLHDQSPHAERHGQWHAARKKFLWEVAMTPQAKCPMCANGVLTRTDGKLDQSGETYLPTTAWACDVCGCVRYDAAKVAAWRPTTASVS
jgi:hypothetical protein